MEEQKLENQEVEVLAKGEIKACRHRLERRWYRRLIEINTLLIVVVIAIVFSNLNEYKELGTKVWTQLEKEFTEAYEEAMADMESSDETAETEAENNSDEVLVEEEEEEFDFSEEDIPLELQMFVTGFVTIIALYFVIYYMYATYRTMSLRITEKNFPEVYQLIENYAKKLGMKKVPEAYVMQGNGILNAFSMFVIGKQYIQINTEIFEVAYREHHDMDSLGFVIAHEMAHIYYGHATLHYNLPILFANSIPVVGAIASRAREYSCDRLAQRVSGSDGVSAMFMLMVDRHLYTMVDREDYLEQAKKQKGFFVWIYNLVSSHPVMSKRIVALDEKEGSGKLY